MTRARSQLRRVLATRRAGVALVAALAPAACVPPHTEGLYHYDPAAMHAPPAGSRDEWTVRGVQPGFVVEDASRAGQGSAVRVRGTGPFYAGGVAPDAPDHQRAFRARAMAPLWERIQSDLGPRAASGEMAAFVMNGGWYYHRHAGEEAWTVVVPDWRYVDAAVTRIGAFLAARELCEQVFVRVLRVSRYSFSAEEL